MSPPLEEIRENDSEQNRNKFRRKPKNPKGGVTLLYIPDTERGDGVTWPAGKTYSNFHLRKNKKWENKLNEKS